MKRTLLLLALIAQGLAAAAQDSVWKSITDWEQYLTDEDMGRAIEYALYDVDDDGINEALVSDGEGQYALLCCGTGKIKCIVSSFYNSELSIIDGGASIIIAGSCGSGCVSEQIYKLNGSKREYMLERIMYVSPDGDEDVQCTLYAGGNSKEITTDFYAQKSPSLHHLISMGQLKWSPIISSNYTKPEPPTIDRNRAALVIERHHSGDTIFAKDAEDYFYELYSDGTAAVAPGGAYMGDVIIPPLLDLDGDLYRVTVVRRGAMWKKADTPNIGRITSVTLPETVTLVGADAFRDNNALTDFNCSPSTHVEVRSFWGCPNISLDDLEPVYGFTKDCFDATTEEQVEAHTTFYCPTDTPEDYQQRFAWAFFKYNHGMLDFEGWSNIDSDEAMACWSANLDNVRSFNYSLRNKDNAASMFKGYLDESSTVVIADNAYVGTHEFPAFSRYTSSEEPTEMPKAFVQTLEKQYGAKARYSFEVGHVLYSPHKEQLAITEFEIINHKARYVLSWIADGKVVCSYTDTTDVSEDYDGWGLWNVDDDGSYGIPSLLTIARDEKGNIELFLEHVAPESSTLTHLKQHGNKFEEVNKDYWYLMMN